MNCRRRRRPKYGKGTPGKKLIILIYISLPPLSKSTRAVKDHRPVFHLCISLYLLIANNNKKNWRSHYLFDDVAAAAALFCLA